MGLFSKPLKIEIQDVFMILKPKQLDDWKEEVELKAYKDGVQGMLEQLEMIFKS